MRDLEAEAQKLKMTMLAAGHHGMIHWARYHPDVFPPLCVTEEPTMPIEFGGLFCLTVGYARTVQALEVAG